MAAAVTGIAVALAFGIYAQDRSEIFLLVLDKQNVPVLDVKPSDISIQEEAGPGTVVSVDRFGWPLKLTVLVDNGPGTAEALVPLRNGLTSSDLRADQRPTVGATFPTLIG